MQSFVRAKADGLMRRLPFIRQFFSRLSEVSATEMRRFSSYLYDYNNDRRYIGWKAPSVDYWKRSSELIFHYHKLEKGLCIPGPKRFFGESAAFTTCRLLREWEAVGLDTRAQIYRAALEVLRSYRSRLHETPPPQHLLDRLIPELDERLFDRAKEDGFRTPIPSRAVSSGAIEHFETLCMARRSTRSFAGEAVDFSRVERALAIAQLSPSACNRQPWRAHFYEDRQGIDAMLALQNGNAGFGPTIPLLAVITADFGTFFDASERIEPMLDGGLFLMSFLLALQALGLSSCCLNWCVSPKTDALAHEVGNIPRTERILTFLAIGVATSDALVPLSARRPLTDVVRRKSL